jgi:hypothetical protein
MLRERKIVGFGEITTGQKSLRGFLQPGLQISQEYNDEQTLDDHEQDLANHISIKDHKNLREYMRFPWLDETRNTSFLATPSGRER